MKKKHALAKKLIEKGRISLPAWEEVTFEVKLPSITENQFLKQVLQLAKLRGWRTCHFRPAMNKRGQWMTAVQGDGAGWPDIILVRPPRILAVELKVGKNKTTPEQDVWLEQLSKCGIYAAVWRPEMWETIETILK